jgi:hypothetical protein
VGQTIGHAWQDTRSTTRVTFLEIVFVGALLVLVQTFFFGYYTGTTSPGGDFMGPYLTEAYAWWHDGGLFQPPDWMPYVWGGYPTVASVQNSAWYLPVGLASLFGYDIHAATVVQAAHVAAAGLGMYVLGRRLGFGRIAAATGLVAYSFTTGFFTNAPYVDIVRGHALAPWVLLCLSPLWPWARRWAVPAAALLLWQVAVGVYPGMLIVFAYGGVVWVVAWQLIRRPRPSQFLLPLSLSGFAALLLSLPKYLPLVALQTIKPGDVENLSVLERSTLGTFVLPVFDGLPGIPTLNSYFVPATVLLLCGFAAWRSRPVRPALAVLVVAAVISVPAFDWVLDAVPGIGSSRFRQNDARAFIFVPLVILAMSGLATLIDAGRLGRKPRRLASGLGVIGLVLGGTILFLTVGRFREGDWIPSAVTLGVSALVVVSIALTCGRAPTGGIGARVTAMGVVVVIATAASGIAASRATTSTWAMDAAAAQRSLWGVESSELISHTVEPDKERRRARSAIDDPTAPEDLIDPRYNSSYFTGLDSVGGYLNVQNSPSYVEARRALLDPAVSASAAALLQAPGVIVAWPGSDLPAPETIESCSTSTECGGVSVDPVSYGPGRLVYEVASSTPMRVIVNEAYYPGWTALLVDDHGRAHALPVELGPVGLIQLTLPEGSWRLMLSYDTPYGAASGILAAVGALALVLWSIAGGLTRRRARPTHRMRSTSEFRN